MKKGVYSAEEAAGLLGVSRRRFADLISKGRLAAKEEAGAVVIRGKDLAEFVFFEVRRAFYEILDFIGRDVYTLKELYSLCESFEPFAFNRAVCSIFENCDKAEIETDEDFSNVKKGASELCFMKNCIVDLYKDTGEEIRSRGDLMRLAARSRGKKDARDRVEAVKRTGGIIRGFASQLADIQRGPTDDEGSKRA